MEYEKKKWWFIYNIFPMTILSFLEASPDQKLQIVDNPSTERTYRTLTGYWIIVALFLTLAYFNEFVVNKISPISPPSNLTTFSQLESFRFYTPTEFQYTRRFHDKQNFIPYSYTNYLYYCALNPNNQKNFHCASRFGTSFSCTCLILTNLLAQMGISSSPKKLNTSSSSVLRHDFMITPYTGFRKDQVARTYQAVSTCKRKALIEDVDILETFIEYTQLKD